MTFNLEPVPILSVDPGHVSGFAVFFQANNQNNYYLARYGKMKPTKAKKTEKIIDCCVDKLVDCYEMPNKMIMLVETQYLAVTGQQGLSIDKLMRLVVNRARWEVIAERKEGLIEIKYVKPNQWQSKMLGASRRMKRDERKITGVRFAQSFYRGATFTPDESDAVLMGMNQIRVMGKQVVQDHYPLEGERL